MKKSYQQKIIVYIEKNVDMDTSNVFNCILMSVLVDVIFLKKEMIGYLFYYCLYYLMFSIDFISNF